MIELPEEILEDFLLLNREERTLLALELVRMEFCTKSEAIESLGLSFTEDDLFDEACEEDSLEDQFAKISTDEISDYVNRIMNEMK